MKQKKTFITASKSTIDIFFSEKREKYSEKNSEETTNIGC